MLADAGYDSHENHRFARKAIGVRALIKAGIGRPGAPNDSGDQVGPDARLPMNRISLVGAKPSRS